MFCDVIGVERDRFTDVVSSSSRDIERVCPPGELPCDVGVQADRSEVARRFQTVACTAAVSWVECLYTHAGFQCIDLEEKELEVACLHADVVLLVYLRADSNPLPRLVSVGCFL